MHSQLTHERLQFHQFLRGLCISRLSLKEGEITGKMKRNEERNRKKQRIQGVRTSWACKRMVGYEKDTKDTKGFGKKYIKGRK